MNLPLLYVDNKVLKILTPGIYDYWKNTMTISVSKVDMRRLKIEILGQEVLTRDRVFLRVDFFIQYRIIDIAKAIIDTRDYEKELYACMQCVLRNILAQIFLDELLLEDSQITESIRNSINDSSSTLGIVILTGGITNIVVPDHIKMVMSHKLVKQKLTDTITITSGKSIGQRGVQFVQIGPISPTTDYIN